MTRYAIFAVAALTACAGEKGGDTGDGTGLTGNCPNGVYEGPTSVVYASVACDDTDVVRFYAETEGWTLDGFAFAQETSNTSPSGQWSDSITMESYEFDECQEWDKLEHTLVTGADFEDYDPGVNTLFTCAAHYDPGNAVMTYAVAVNDTTGALADCLAWGHDVDGMKAGTYDRANEPEFDISICEEGVPAR